MLPPYSLFQAVPGKVEAELANGLICGHAYSITAVRKVSIGKVFNMSSIADSKKNSPVVWTFLLAMRPCSWLQLNANTLKKIECASDITNLQTTSSVNKLHELVHPEEQPQI